MTSSYGRLNNIGLPMATLILVLLAAASWLVPALLAVQGSDTMKAFGALFALAATAAIIVNEGFIEDDPLGSQFFTPTRTVLTGAMLTATFGQLTYGFATGWWCLLAIAAGWLTAGALAVIIVVGLLQTSVPVFSRLGDIVFTIAWGLAALTLALLFSWFCWQRRPATAWI